MLSKLSRIFRTPQKPVIPPIQLNFFKAIMGGDLNTVRLVLILHPEAAKWEILGEDALTVAVMHKQAAITNVLLLHGADPHRVSNGQTPQTRAAHYGWRLYPHGLETGARTVQPEAASVRKPDAPAPSSAQAGAFVLTAEGYLCATTGNHPASFGSQKEAGLWIVQVGSQSLRHVFQVANDPAASGRFAIEDREHRATQARLARR